MRRQSYLARRRVDHLARRTVLETRGVESALVLRRPPQLETSAVPIALAPSLLPLRPLMTALVATLVSLCVITTDITHHTFN